jgi:hypothetical protein
MNNLNRLHLIVVLGVVAIVGCSRSDSDQLKKAPGDAAKAPSALKTAKTEPAKPKGEATKDPASNAAGDTTAPPALGKGAIVDPASNLTGDPMRTFMDILETTIRADGDNFVLEVLTAAPFPSPSEMAGGKRFDFIWFIDIDKNQKTGQSDRGNDYNIHLFLAESGWETSWYKVSSISENDGVTIHPDEIKIGIDGHRATLTFPKRYLPSKSFKMWASCFTGNAEKWPPLTENPHTQTGVFDF